MNIHKISPNFEVSDIQKTVAFYVDHLGFKLIMAVAESQDGIDTRFMDNKAYVYALVQRDQIEFMFQRSDTFKNDVIFSKGLNIGASVSFYMEIEGIEAFYLVLKSKNLELTELKTAWYGMQEFYLKDPNGYILGFAEAVQKQ